MQFPSPLSKGDRVALVAPARKISKPEILFAIQTLEGWGLQVVLGNFLFAESNQFAGTDAQRASDLQIAFDDPEIKAIFCARGGYGTVRIIDQLDFTQFCKNPKWIVGFSDTTVLHSHIHANFGTATLHAAMPLTFPKEEAFSDTLNDLQETLFGKQFVYEISSDPKNRAGNASGELVGGNLSILHTLTGTSSDIDTQGKILFIEDLDEYLYHIDRMMVHLKRSGKLANLAGLVVGGMTKMNDNSVPFGKTAEEIIFEAVVEYDYPVCFGFPAGHQPLNLPLVLGATAQLTIDKTTAALHLAW